MNDIQVQRTYNRTAFLYASKYENKHANNALLTISSKANCLSFETIKTKVDQMLKKHQH